LQLRGPDSLIGKAVIVHAEQDDFESQPSGDAGARVGCGVIRKDS
jgi:Cu-Zn family superoxide dismutase